jgi:hypothetical protein
LAVSFHSYTFSRIKWRRSLDHGKWHLDSCLFVCHPLPWVSLLPHPQLDNEPAAQLDICSGLRLPVALLQRQDGAQKSSNDLSTGAILQTAVHHHHHHHHHHRKSKIIGRETYGMPDRPNGRERLISLIPRQASSTEHAFDRQPTSTTYR